MNIFQEHLDLVQRVVYHGLGSLTPEERQAVKRSWYGVNYPELTREFGWDHWMEDFVMAEDLRVWGHVLGYL